MVENSIFILPISIYTSQSANLNAIAMNNAINKKGIQISVTPS